VDDDSDPFNAVKEWWNTGDRHYATPRLHLFEQLGLSANVGEGVHSAGKGTVIYRKASPLSFTRDEKGADAAVSLAQSASKSAGLKWKETNYLLLRRGPYVIAAGLDENPMSSVKTVKGRFINLFDPKLAVESQVTITPGTRHYLLDLDALGHAKPSVLASASKVLGETATAHRLRFHSEGPSETKAATRIALPSPPTSVKVGDDAASQIEQTWDEASHTLLLTYPNSPDGVWVEVNY
jgi:hypothetical protein